MLEAILYAEVYLVCMIVVGLLWLWTARKVEISAAELWLQRVFGFFVLNFLCNFLFTLFNRIWVFPSVVYILSYGLKSLYLATLACGVFCWCGYAETTLQSTLFQNRKSLIPLNLALVGCFLLIIINLFTHVIFEFDENCVYQRHPMFQFFLTLLFIPACLSSIRLLRQTGRESDPYVRSHFRLIASFPLCILIAILLSFIGESVPVICVCVVVELLCIFIGNTTHQISIDMLTRVNNRQNLNRYINYKLAIHDEQLWLIMIDIDYFKHINDTYGHLEGDRALINVADVLKQACVDYKPRPFIARYGGDEFVIVVEGQQENAQAIQEKIHALLKNYNTPEHPYPLEVSLGCARYKSGMTFEEFMTIADNKLYEMKNARR